MANGQSERAGAPCWADLWTSDVPGARKFYGELFGWEAEDPEPEFGGYFSFTRQGVRIAGCMGDMGEDMKANNTWKPYLATDDTPKTLAVAEANHAQVTVPAMAVADLGVQGVLVDPGGATIGVWQPGSFAGFAVTGEPGAPSWFELQTCDYAGAIEFYRSTFVWEVTVASDTDELRYTTFRSSVGGEDVGGIMDASAFRPEATPDEWSIYWEVEDCAAAVARVKALGGTAIMGPDDTPYGVLALVADPSGAQFKLRASPRA